MCSLLGSKHGIASMSTLSLRADQAHKVSKPYYFERMFEAIEDGW